MSYVIIPDRFVVKRDTAANFTSANTLLLQGEWALELDTGKMKMGDGSTAWNSLPYKTLDVAAPCFVYTTDTGSTADSDPGSGLMKWNNATQSSATKLFFDDATANTGTDLSALFTELAASSTAGIIHMVAGDGAFQVYKWTGIADGTGYFKFTVTHLCSSGAFADNITVRVAFLPMPPSSGGGGSIAWTLLNSWDFAVSGAVANIEAALSGYNEVLVVVQNVTLAASGYRAFQVSSNGGTSWQTSYDYLDQFGVRATSSLTFTPVQNTASTSSRSGSGQFSLLADAESRVMGNEILVSSGSVFQIPALGTKPNRVKVGGWTLAGATTNMTAGKVFIYAR